jgi:hypothetical protein
VERLPYKSSALVLENFTFFTVYLGNVFRLILRKITTFSLSSHDQMVHAEYIATTVVLTVKYVS